MVHRAFYCMVSRTSSVMFDFVSQWASLVDECIDKGIPDG